MNNKRLRIILPVYGMLILIIFNLILALNDYNIKSVGINEFFYMQTKRQFTSGGKVGINQVYRENLIEKKQEVAPKMDSANREAKRKIYIVQHRTRYVKIN